MTILVTVAEITIFVGNRIALKVPEISLVSVRATSCETDQIERVVRVVTRVVKSQILFVWLSLAGP